MAYTITGGRIETAKKVVLYGPEGIGKSTFAGCFPQPVFIDTEHSTDHMDVARFPHPDSWTMLLGEVQQVRDDPDCCRTLVIDTADWAEKLCCASLLARTKKDGIESFGYGKGYVYLSEDFAKLLHLLEEVRGRGVHVVLTAHAALRKFEQPDEMGSYDRWELKMTKQITPLIKEWADLLLFANYKTNRVVTENGKGKAVGGSRVMYTAHHPCWDAKNRYGLPEELPFAFEAIAPLFGADINVRTAAAPTAGHAFDRFAPQMGELLRAAHGAPVSSSKAMDISRADVPPQPGTTPQPAPDAPAAAQTAPAAAAAAPTSTDTCPPAPPRQDPQAPAQRADAAERDGIAPQLRAMMSANAITPAELQRVVGDKGYFPEDMPVWDYPQDFIDGWCLPNWERILNVVQSNRMDLPF